MRRGFWVSCAVSKPNAAGGDVMWLGRLRGSKSMPKLCGEKEIPAYALRCVPYGVRRSIVSFTGYLPSRY